MMPALGIDAAPGHVVGVDRRRAEVDELARDSRRRRRARRTARRCRRPASLRRRRPTARPARRGLPPGRRRRRASRAASARERPSCCRSPPWPDARPSDPCPRPPPARARCASRVDRMGRRRGSTHRRSARHGGGTGIAMPAPRFCSSPRVRSSTVTSQPQRDRRRAAGDVPADDGYGASSNRGHRLLKQ